MTTLVTIKLLIEGEPADALHAANEALDHGALQDAINSYDDGLVEVTSAVVVLGDGEDDADDDDSTQPPAYIGRLAR